jgi:hypothetical protein
VQKRIKERVHFCHANQYDHENDNTDMQINLVEISETRCRLATFLDVVRTRGIHTCHSTVATFQQVINIKNLTIGNFLKQVSHHNIVTNIISKRQTF